MSVEVRIPTPLRRVTNGQEKASVEGNNLIEIIDALEAQHPGIKERMCDDDGSLRHFVNIYVNGEDVRFLTGTDEHGKKVQNAAEAAGKNPKEFVDETSKKFKEAWKALNVIPNRFIRTTDKDHINVVKDFIEKCNKKGDIYKGTYEGNYCVNCEAYVTEKDLVDNECPYHPGKKIEKISEESYFFKLSKYQDFLLDLYKKHPEFVLPDSRRNEIINRVKDGLNDLSITRTSFDWGIPFPLDKKHVTYVWFDALINYYTGEDGYWPADVHILGKDNTWFHTVYWPAMLKSVGYKLPKTIFNHGFLTFNGQKISKSLGNVISPVVLVEKYGADSIRYYALRQFPFANGDDGDFSEEVLARRHNDELANKLGNLVSRVSIILWDIVSFGFLECIVCKLPTMGELRPLCGPFGTSLSKEEKRS